MPFTFIFLTAPSRLTRASSDPPPDNLKRNNSTQFELEPNPFEQSFSGSGYSKNTSDTRSTASQLQADAQVKPRRARSQSPVGTPNPATQSGNTSTASGSALRSSTGYSRLPPLSALTSPATEALQASFWGMDNNHSLRSGPLSPAMLQGPSATSSATNMPSSQAFDPNTFRTGLTPSGSMANPPGPATAALFALMTNATPGGQPPNQFEMNFAKHMDQQPHDARPRISEQFSKDSSDSMNSMHSGTQASGPASSVPSQQYQAPMAHGQMPTVAPHLSGLPAHMQQHAPGGHNPLYLFSQATANDFPGGSEDDLLAVNALRNLNSPQLPGAPHTMQNNHSFAQAVEGLPVTAPSSMLTGHASRPQASTLPQQPATYSGGLPGHPGMTMAPQGLNSAPSVPTRKRKTASSEASQDPEPETNARGTRKRAAASKRVKAEEGLSEDEHSPVSATRRDSLVPLEDMPTVRPLTKEEKKCMSEEDKRKNFLERNRQGVFLFVTLGEFALLTLRIQ